MGDDKNRILTWTFRALSPIALPTSSRIAVVGKRDWIRPLMRTPFTTMCKLTCARRSCKTADWWGVVRVRVRFFFGGSDGWGDLRLCSPSSVSAMPPWESDEGLDRSLCRLIVSARKRLAIGCSESSSRGRIRDRSVSKVECWMNVGGEEAGELWSTAAIVTSWVSVREVQGTSDDGVLVGFGLLTGCGDGRLDIQKRNNREKERKGKGPRCSLNASRTYETKVRKKRK